MTGAYACHLFDTALVLGATQGRAKILASAARMSFPLVGLRGAADHECPPISRSAAPHARNQGHSTLLTRQG